MRSILYLFLTCMSSFATELGLPGSRSFAIMFEFRVASFPVVAEYLSISKFSHDCSLLRYLKNFPGGLWPNLTPIPETVLKIYAGRSVNFERRHIDHGHRIHCSTASGQIPAYHALRQHTSHGLLPVASFFMLPVVSVAGSTPESVVAERVFLGNFSFKLNTPHVYKHFAELFPFRLNVGGTVCLSMREDKSGKARPLSKHTRNGQSGTERPCQLHIPTRPKAKTNNWTHS